MIKPNWPAPPHVKAYVTSRQGGVSLAPFDQLNLGDHVGDHPAHVAANRQWLQDTLGWVRSPCWLKQVHGHHVVEATPAHLNQVADASFTDQLNQICVILTADCLSLLVCTRGGEKVAAIHAGWRGLAAGVIESTLQALQWPATELVVWLGPAISMKHYEIGEEVRDIFLKNTPSAEHAFYPSRAKHWMMDLLHLARLRLNQWGVTEIYGGDYCTYTHKELFYSHRRDGNKTGRMASLIWISK